MPGIPINDRPARTVVPLLTPRSSNIRIPPCRKTTAIWRVKTEREYVKALSPKFSFTLRVSKDVRLIARDHLPPKGTPRSVRS